MLLCTITVVWYNNQRVCGLLTWLTVIFTPRISCHSSMKPIMTCATIVILSWFVVERPPALCNQQDGGPVSKTKEDLTTSAAPKQHDGEIP
jgi:hypothetical protein